MKKTGPFRFDVFLSYNRAQKEWTRNLARRLRANDLIVWFDEWELPKHAGSNWVDLLVQGVEQSRKVVLVWSPEFFANEWPEFEASVIQELDPVGRQHRVVPLLHTECDIPKKWGFRQRLNFVGSSLGSPEFEFGYQLLLYNLDPSRFVVPDPQRFSPEKIKFAHQVRRMAKLWRLSAFFLGFSAIGVLASTARDNAGSFSAFTDLVFGVLLTEMTIAFAFVSWGLLKLRRWGRRMAIILCILFAVWYPLSWYTLWVLIRTEDARKLYEEITQDAR